MALPGRIGYGFGLSSVGALYVAVWLSVRRLGAFSVCPCVSVRVTVSRCLKGFKRSISLHGVCCQCIMALYMAFKGVFSVCGTSYHIRHKNSYTDVIRRYGRIKDGSIIADRVKHVLIVSGILGTLCSCKACSGPLLRSWNRSGVRRSL